MRRRQPAQAIGIAAISLVAMVGTLAFVMDAGFLFMAHREAQDAADAAALAGVHAFTNGDATSCDPGSDCATAVETYASGNYGILGRLCSRPGAPIITVGSLNTPKVPTLSVTVSCTASLTFGRILWDPGHSRIFDVSATAIAAIGNAAMDGTGKQTGEITDFTKNPTSIALGGTQDTIVFNDPQFAPAPHSLKGYQLQFSPGARANAGLSRPIFDNDTTSITVNPPFTSAPITNDQFTVLQHLTRLIH